MIFVLIYFILMLGCLACFIHYNRTHKWITKLDYACDDGPMIATTLFGILFYPVTLIVVLFMYVWKQFIPDR